MEFLSDREARLLSITKKLMEILSTNALFAEGIKSYLAWYTMACKDIKVNSFQKESLDFLKQEYGLDYTIVTKDDIAKRGETHEL
jgi:hypothetical protein